ncbi:hypothetical protein ACOSP7_004916 [Xanthoceras sorbifolium]
MKVIAGHCLNVNGHLSSQQILSKCVWLLVSYSQAMIKNDQKVVWEYVVQEGFQLKMIKNDAECAVESCPWRIHASTIVDKTTFMIKTMNDIHNCLKVRKNQEANST